MTAVGSVAVSTEKPIGTIPGCWTIRCVGLSSKPSMSSAFTVSGGHRRAVQRLVRAPSHLKKSYQVQEESLHELRVRAHQPIELGTLGKGGEGICEVGL